MRKAKFLTIALTFFLVLAVSVFADTCYNSVKDIPATCEGGSLSQDSWNGCRKIVCSSGGNSQQILACDKSGFFEMYKQTTVGSGVSKVCIGSTCISNSGYAKSSNFPICMGTSPNTTNTTNPLENNTNSTPPWTNQTNNTQNNGACYTKVNQLPVTCTGGTVTTDTGSGCRTVVCTSGSSSLKAMACDKPTTTSPTYFEVYKQSQTGTAVSKICFGSSCVGGAGFAKGNYPVCTDASPNTTNTTATATVRRLTERATEHNAVLSCDAPGFVPAEFRWDFGDGKTAVKNAGNAVHGYPEWFDSWNTYYHTYTQSGNYVVKCTAINGSLTATGQATITITTPATQSEIAATLPAEPDDSYNPFIFRPVAKQVAGATYDVGGYSLGLPRDADNGGQSGAWAYSLGFSSQFTSTHDNILRVTFPEPGTYHYFPVAGYNYDLYSPEYYTTGRSMRGCSNPRTTCQGSSGAASVTIPDLGTRTEYGIMMRSGTELSCQSYATDVGASGYIVVDNDWSNAKQFTGNQWLAFSLSPGDHTVECRQDVGDGLQKIYQETVTVGGTTPPASNASATVTIAPWYPKGRDYIFECNAQGFTPTRYDYSFGDGHTWDDVTFDDTYHSYANAGTYSVTCTAENGQISKTGSMTVRVQ